MTPSSRVKAILTGQCRQLKIQTSLGNLGVGVSSKEWRCPLTPLSRAGARQSGSSQDIRGREGEREKARAVAARAGAGQTCQPLHASLLSSLLLTLEKNLLCVVNRQEMI